MSDPTATGPDLSRLKIDRSRGPRRRSGPNWMLLLVLGAIVAGGWWWWQNKRAPESRPEARVDDGPRLVSAELWQPDAGGSIAANGYVIARRRAALSTVLSGRLIEINVEEGSQVEEGQIVARIQSDDYESALAEADRALAAADARLDQARTTAQWQKTRVAQAESDVKVIEQQIDGARTDLGEAERDRDRNETNFKKGVITEADWDRVATQVKRLGDQLDTRLAELARSRSTVETVKRELAGAEAGIAIAESEKARAEAARTSAQVLLDKTIIRAPFAGVIVNKGAEQGEVVAATGAGGNSRGSVATLVDPATLEVQIELPETRLGSIREDQSVEIYLDVEPARAWPGRVRQIWPTADRGKGTVEIRATFAERPALLRPEMGARVVFLTADRKEDAPRLVAVPASALKKDGDQNWLFVVTEGVLVRRDVQMDSKTGDRAILSSGVAAGDRVVDRPGRDLRAGERFND